MNPATGVQRPMTFPQAQKVLGMKGPRGLRLKRYVLNREREIGKKIARRNSSAKYGVRYTITMTALRRYCPDLFPSKVDELRRTFDAYIDSIDGKIEERVTAHVSEHVDPRLDELWQRDEIIAKSVTDLATRVERILGANRT